MLQHAVGIESALVDAGHTLLLRSRAANALHGGVHALTSACPRRRSIIYYSTKIFQQAGFESKSAAIGGTVAMGLVKLLFETHSLLNLDHAGRRPLLLLGAVGLTASLLGLGLSMQLKLAGGVAGPSPATAGICVSLAAYMAFHALSYGPITWLVLAEILPNKVRGKAMGIATMANRLTSFLVASSFLTMSERLQWSGSFYLYAAVAAASFVFYALFVPETSGLTLEQISPIFADPASLVRENAADLRRRATAALTRDNLIAAATAAALFGCIAVGLGTAAGS